MDLFINAVLTASSALLFCYWFRYACLDRDFAILACLLEQTHTAAFAPSFEDVMLRIHFRSLSTCFRLTSKTLQESSTAALEEMSRVVAHLANELGARQATVA